MKRMTIAIVMAIVIVIGCAMGACGETGTYTVTFSGAEIAEQLVTMGEKATRPLAEPNKAGYNFEGWYKDASYSERFVFEEEVITKDTTIYVKFDVKTYVVTYMNTDAEPESVEHNGTIKTANPTPPAGKAFDGWYIDATHTKRFEKDTKITKNLELWAKWKDVEAPPLPSDSTVTATFVNPSTGEETWVEVEKGEAVSEKKVPDFYHKFERYYRFKDWDGDVAAPLYSDITFTALFYFESTTVIPYDYFDFKLLDDGTYGISGKILSEGEARRLPNVTGSRALPTTYNDKPVSVVFDLSTINSKLNLNELLVPANYKRVGDGAFAHLPCLYLYLESVEEIGANAFYSSSVYSDKTLGEIYLPTTLREINIEALKQNLDLKYVLEPNENFILKKDAYGNEFFMDSAETKVFWVDGKGKTIRFPATVKEFSSQLISRAKCETIIFEGDVECLPREFAKSNSNLKKIIFLGKLKRVEVYALWCDNLVIERLPEGLEYVDKRAFGGQNSGVIINELVLSDSLFGKDLSGISSATLLAISVAPVSEKYYEVAGGIVERGSGVEYDGKKGDTFLFYSRSAAVSEYFVPEGVTTFRADFGTIFNNDNMKRLVVPEGVQHLPHDFIRCGWVRYEVDLSTGKNFIVESGSGTEYISLPSTLRSIGDDNRAMVITGWKFEGFEWPNGSNLEFIGDFGIFMNDMERLVLPASMKDLGGVYAVSGIKNVCFEPGGDMFSIDQNIFLKLNDVDVKVVRLVLTVDDTEVRFPDLGDLTIKVIGNNATYIIDRTIFLGAIIPKLVVPEGVELIEMAAFYMIAPSLRELVLPSTLKRIENAAFFNGRNLEKQTITFLGEEPPEFVRLDYTGNNFFYEDIFDTRAGGGYLGINPNCTIHVPEGSYRAYFEKLFGYKRFNYVSRLSDEFAEKRTYRFHNGAGNEIADIEWAAVLLEEPFVFATVDDSLNFHGFWTKDGSSDGLWGQKVKYPFFGESDGEGVCHLYAKWSVERDETGESRHSAYLLTEQKRELIVPQGKEIGGINYSLYTFFEFTATREGEYALFADGEYEQYIDYVSEGRGFHAWWGRPDYEKGVDFPEFLYVFGSKGYLNPVSDVIGDAFRVSVMLREGETVYICVALGVLSWRDEDGTICHLTQTKANFWVERVGDFIYDAISQSAPPAMLPAKSKEG